jgi:hypothetical protein
MVAREFSAPETLLARSEQPRNIAHEVIEEGRALGAHTPRRNRTLTRP